MVKLAAEAGKGAQAGSAGAASLSDSSGNDPFGLTQWMPGASLHPLMAHPTAAVAAATAVGIGITSQLAGFMLGAMQGFVEATQKTAAAVEPSVAVGEPLASVMEAVAVKPVAKPKEQKRPRAARIVEARADDLKRISGIGPKLEQVLNGMGIRQFADIARWTEKDVQRVDEQLGFAGRIVRDGWVVQAKALLKG